MKKKFYAVKCGKIPGIYGTWDETKQQVDGFPGAVYKSFSILEEAEAFILDQNVTNEIEFENKNSDDYNQEVENKINALSTDEAVAFVDGTYDATEEKSGFGAILISQGGNKEQSYKSFTKNLGEDFIQLRNVAAELEGVKEAVTWAVGSGKKKLSIYYDYEGIEKWATGEWRAKKKLTKEYAIFIQEKSNIIEIEFIKVPAHSGVVLNEEADALAKSSLLTKGHKTYTDGSVYFVGYKAEDWKTIIDCVNEENSQLDEDKEGINITVSFEQIDYREKITCTYFQDKVTINCYRGMKSYVQGKQSVLLQKIVSTAIDFLASNQSAIETLNNYYALSIHKDDVDIYFDKYVPDYKGTTNDKIYRNLLSAVYNTMLTGYMPDYTCLLMPIFRAYEFCLHRILGDKMELKTEDDKGRNVFSYFDKDATGMYSCNKNTDKLSSVQNDFLDKLYTTYNRVRHIYSHWSFEEVDVAVISDVNEAREYLYEGLTLVNEYYKLF